VSAAPEVGDLVALDRLVDNALRRADLGPLEVLGYGEISCVVAWRAGDVPVACKRLPPFRDGARLDGYRAALATYLDRLRDRGIDVVPTALQTVPRTDGTIGAYLVQPALDPGAVGPTYVAAAARPEAVAFFARIVERIAGCVGDRLGLDGQLSNWAWVGGRMQYLDVSTPMVRDEGGRELLDTELFLASLPWLLRGAVRRFLLASILDQYYTRRGVLLDLLGNLHKERLERYLEPVLALVQPHVDPPIDAREIRRYYDGDARMWALLQRVRRLDRAWQRRVRRRVYPFLLPGRIER
jgi:hypothetical protein